MEPAPSPTRPKIGLALGGGGAKACVYIGFYEVLQEHNIPIDYIAGTSMGAIIGAAIALGYSPAQLREFFLKYSSYNVTSLFNFNFFNESLFKRDKFDQVLKEMFGEKTFADLRIPFVCSAVDLEARKEVVFREGPLFPALASSSAYPLLLPPIFHDSKYLVDGGVMDNVPGVLARELMEGKLIAFRLRSAVVRQYIAGQVFQKHYEFKAQKKTPFFKRKLNDFKFLIDIVMEVLSIASDRYVHENISKAQPDLLLEPLVDVQLTDFSKVDELIKQGRQIAQEQLPKIQEWLAGNEITS